VTVYVRHPEEDRDGRIFTLKTNLDCLDNLRLVWKLDGCLTSLDRFLTAFYSTLGFSGPLLSYDNFLKFSVEQASIPAQFQSAEFQGFCVEVPVPEPGQ
jgi:hypothetical protein